WSPDFVQVQEFLQLLARAVRQFHTYPATSPLCVDAVNACRSALLAMQMRDRIVFRVTPRELVVDDTGVGAGTVIEQELVRRLRQETALPADTPVKHLYPPDKGWVRLDPAANFDAVSLIDLTILVDDPAHVATMLLRLTDEEPLGQEASERALEQKFSDVAML